jgi:beta-carotene 3-hydroxylase
MSGAWSPVHGLAPWASALLAVVAMEYWAAFLHRRVWHGPLWWIHRTHHAPRSGAFEANDWLSALHAPVAMVLIVVGSRARPGLGHDLAVGFGGGMTAFGALYVLVHDGLVHGRLPVKALERIHLLRLIARAHRLHHRAGGGPPYGLLFGTRELRRSPVALRRRRGRPSTGARPTAPGRG